MDAQINKVFGIGLSRTATRTLAVALDRLGFRAAHFPADEETFRQLTEGDYRLSVLERFDALTDTPVALCYRQLDRVYPHSRFILTVRDIDAWLDSCQRLWHHTRQAQARPYHSFINAAVYGTWHFAPERFRDVYERHLREVQHYFADRPADLLTVDLTSGAGWAPLCQFLGRELPSEPFPHEDLLGGVPPGLSGLSRG